jgi:hypothetical protein
LKKFFLMSFVWSLGLVFIYWKSSGDWQAIAAVATWFLVLGVVFAFYQVKQSRKSTNAQIAIELFRELRREEVVQIIRYIYNLQPKEDGTYLTDTHKAEIEYLLERLDLLGSLVHQGVTNQYLAIEGFGGPAILRCWFQLYYFITETRKARGFYVDNYEAFVYVTIKYFKKKHINVMYKNKSFNELLIEMKNNNMLPKSACGIRKYRKKIYKKKG